MKTDTTNSPPEAPDSERVGDCSATSCSAQKRIKHRLKIKRLTKRINAGVEENFGYSPDYSWFHKDLTDRIELLDWSRHHDGKWCELFDDYELKDKGHLTPTF